MFRLLIPCLIWLSTVRSEMAGMQMAMPSGMPLGTERVSEDGGSMLLKTKRDSIHQPCGPSDYHSPGHVHAPYPPSPIYIKPYIQQTYLKKELGVAPSHHSHMLQYIQQPPAYAATAVVPKPSVTYVKPVAAAIDHYHSHQQSVAHYVKPVVHQQQPPVYIHKPMPLLHTQIHQNHLHYAPMYHGLGMHQGYGTPGIILKNYENLVPQHQQHVVTPFYQKPLVHASPAIHYATSPKVVQVQEPHVSYVKPVVHPSPPPHIYIPPVHNSVIVKPHCA